MERHGAQFQFAGLLTKGIYFLDILLAYQGKCGSLSGQELFLPVWLSGGKIASVDQSGK